MKVYPPKIRICAHAHVFMVDRGLADCSFTGHVQGGGSGPSSCVRGKSGKILTHFKIIILKARIVLNSVKDNRWHFH